MQTHITQVFTWKIQGLKQLFKIPELVAITSYIFGNISDSEVCVSKAITAITNSGYLWYFAIWTSDTNWALTFDHTSQKFKGIFLALSEICKWKDKWKKPKVPNLMKRTAIIVVAKQENISEKTRNLTNSKRHSLENGLVLLVLDHGTTDCERWYNKWCWRQ